jgi:DNA polymerase-1
MSDNTQKPLILVDGSSYLYRAFHALPNLSAPDGTPTGAMYGVINMLRRLLEEHQPDLLGVVFDAKGKSFRHELYPQYKANRPPMPDELRVQIEPLHELVRALGLPLLSVEGVEADDVIGTLARQASEAGRDVIISTGDKDMAQLVNQHVILMDTMKNTLTDRDGVVEKFGVPPERIVDFLTLVGDSSDNIPGVPKVGPKTAAKWLNEYGSLDELIAHADEIKGKAGENLRACLGQFELTRKLATIDCQLDLGLDIDDLAVGAPDLDLLREGYARFGFSSLLAQLDPGGDTDSAESGGGDWQTVTDGAALDTWMERLEAADLIAFDTETTSLDYMRARIVGVSFAVEPGQAAYVPLAHEYAGAPEQLDRDEVLARLRPLLEDPNKGKVGQNLKYDMSVLANHGIELRGIAHDTMLESYVLDSTAGRHDLDSLAQRVLGHETIHYEDIAGKGAKQIPFQQVPLETAGPYAAEDADIALRLHRSLWPRLEAEPVLKRLYQEVELPLLPVLSRLERTGVLVDADMLAAHSEELTRRLAELEMQAHDAAGQSFNLGSPKQLAEILFDKLQLPVIRKTPKGAPSTAEEVLQELALDYPLPRLVLEYRSLSKLKSTYTDKLPAQINPRTGRVHTSYHQAVAATGRLSSSDPNLQNIPIRTEEGRRIRRAFVAPPGQKILAADYSQIELRIMAHLSADEGLLRAFADGQDIHRATAAEVFGVPPEQISGEQRRSAKAINFGLIYGMSAFGLARQLGIERGEAQSYIDLYFQRYPGVKEYMERTREQAAQRGYVETLFGRRLYLPDIKARNPQRRQGAERAAINAPMQGTAADIIKRAMIDVDAWLGDSDIDARMIMQVHDELVFEVAEEQVERLRAGVVERMARAAELAVELVVDTGVGDNWDEAH